MTTRACIMVLIALLAGGAWFSPASNANGDLDRILGEMEKKARSLSSVYARLTQVKRFAQIGGTESYAGQVFFKHKGRGNDMVRVNYDNGQQVSVIGDVITLYQPRIKQAIITTRKAAAGRNQEFAVFFSPYSLTRAQIKRQYNVVHTGYQRVEGVDTAVIELTPKGASSVKKMRWWVDQSSWMPIRSEITEQGGDVSVFTLSGLKENPSITDGAFKIRIPSGTKIIRN